MEINQLTDDQLLCAEEHTRFIFWGTMPKTRIDKECLQLLTELRYEREENRKLELDIPGE